MADQDLYDLLQTLDPETLKTMLSAGIAPERLGIGQQMAATEQPQGRQVGSTYVASSPLEHLAAALRNFQGQRMMQGAMQDQMAGRGAYLKALAGRPQAPADVGLSPQMVNGDLSQG